MLTDVDPIFPTPKILQYYMCFDKAKKKPKKINIHIGKVCMVKSIANPK